MSYEYMVDVEALGKFCDSVVLSISVVPFKIMDNDSFDDLVSRGLTLKLDINSQLKSGRKIDKDVINWWKRQSPEAKKILVPHESDININDAMYKITEFVQTNGYNKKENCFWSRGIQYDWPIIDYSYEVAKIENPFNKWNLQCTKVIIRTLTCNIIGRYELASGNPSNFIPHNSAHDSALECMKMQEILQKIYQKV